MPTAYNLERPASHLAFQSLLLSSGRQGQCGTAYYFLLQHNVPPAPNQLFHWGCPKPVTVGDIKGVVRILVNGLTKGLASRSLYMSKQGKQPQTDQFADGIYFRKHCNVDNHVMMANSIPCLLPGSWVSSTKITTCDQPSASLTNISCGRIDGHQDNLEKGECAQLKFVFRAADASNPHTVICTFLVVTKAQMDLKTMWSTTCGYLTSPLIGGSCFIQTFFCSNFFLRVKKKVCDTY